MGNLERINALKEELNRLEAEAIREEQQETILRDVPKYVPPPQQTGTNVYGTMSKKSAAAEIINRNKTAKIYTIGAIVSPFLILLAALFNQWVSMAVAGVAVIPSALFLYKLNSENARLQQEYNLR